MQRLVVLVIIALLGIAPIGIVGRSASAQGSSTPTPTEQIETCVPIRSANEDLPWDGVCRPISEDVTISLPTSQTMQSYAVAFKDEFAATEVIKAGDAEFMVVLVQEGSFALDLDPGSSQVVVSTSQDHIETLTPRVEAPPHYGTPAPNGVPLTVNGEVCTRACPVDPDVPVLLVPGDVAIAEKGALCIYCLLHGNTGLLEVFVLRDSEIFTWIRDWDNSPGAPLATPSASTETVVMAWAFLNPGRCDH